MGHVARLWVATVRHHRLVLARQIDENVRETTEEEEDRTDQRQLTTFKRKGKKNATHSVPRHVLMMDKQRRKGHIQSVWADIREQARRKRTGRSPARRGRRRCSAPAARASPQRTQAPDRRRTTAVARRSGDWCGAQMLGNTRTRQTVSEGVGERERDVGQTDPSCLRDVSRWWGT